MSNAIQHLVSFPNYLENICQSPCVVKFTAVWCGPCKKIGPCYQKLAQEHNAKVTFLEIDIDKANEITDYEDVKSIPLFLFYNNGSKLDDLSLKGCDEKLLNHHMEEFIKLTQIPGIDVESEPLKDFVDGIIIHPQQTPELNISQSGNLDLSKLVLDDAASSDDAVDEPSEDFPEYSGDEDGEDCDPITGLSLPENSEE